MNGSNCSVAHVVNLIDQIIDHNLYRVLIHSIPEKITNRFLLIHRKGID